MSGGNTRDLMKAASGDGDWTPVSRADRRTVRAAREVMSEVRIAAIEAEGAFALAGHIMRGVVDLDDERLALAGSDPALAGLLGSIEATAIKQAKRIQANLFTQW